MGSLLDDLNEQQREAVVHGEGPLLVSAGAGSGKTRVLTYRIAHLLASGVADSAEITAVTFTNKAAREMRERVESLLGRPLYGGFVGTFHRWALEVLRRWPRAAGLPTRFGIADADDQRAIMQRALKDLDLDPKELPPRMVLSRISGMVNRGTDRGAFVDRASSASDETVGRLWERYEKLKTAAAVVDFDDMLVRAVRAVREDAKVRDAVARRARFLLVDEFQDTNSLQMDLLTFILDDHGNITAVGDEDQSIYRWRGAELANILSFEKFFPGARVVALEENYRSTEPILTVAGGLIAGNRGRREKTLFTSRQGGEPVRLHIAADERGEARWVADHVESGVGSAPLREMAVLMRTNAQTRPFEEELTRRRVPYRVVGGLRFWQRAEIKDALAYLRLAVRPGDILSFERVINVPARGIGAATMDVLRRTARDLGLSLPEAARQLPEDLSPRARLSLEKFFSILDEAPERREELTPGDFVGWLLEASGLFAMYEGDAEDRVARRENLQQLAAAVAEAAARGQELEEFLDSVALLEENDDQGAADGVALMTLHSAKGLEFDVVFLAGLEDGLLPHANSRDEPEGLEEERRLAYVGMTRARKWLALTGARSRFLFGQRQPTRLSRFLDELPTEAVDDVSEPVASWNASSAAGPVTRPRPTRGDGAMPAKRRGGPVPATVTDADGTGWRPGNRVRHQRFGSGVILACQGTGAQLKLVVFFDRAGRKTLVPTIAKLEKV
ncbi:MAG: UvrD-helicase domain-containing protein [Thermoanaerobaculales bacterium]|nr:UvrD-helicase domain-containing protein [Thermoanaerobaculales bacterium]